MDEKKPRKKKAAADKEHKTPWQETYATMEEIERFIDDRVALRYNVVTHRTEYHKWSGEKGVTHPWQPVNDRLENSLYREMLETTGKEVRFDKMCRLIESDHAPDYHPFRDYLEHLPPWDGESDAILGLSVTVHVKGDAEEQLTFSRYLKKWLVGMVAGWLDAEVVNHLILIFVGQQGIYKTTWFNYLLPPELRQYFYTRTNAQRLSKDDLLALSQYGLVCCEELDTMTPRELNQLKGAVTMTSINERAAYARHAENRKHIATFCGTGNNIQFLSDPSGNRRWMPFEVEWITSPREIPFDYAAIYAQAYGLYKRGFQYWLSETDEEWQRTHNKQFEAPNLEQELVEVFFYPPADPTQGEFMPVSRALQVIGGYVTVKLSASVLGSAFTKQGFQSMRTKHSRGYIVIQRSGDEIKSRLQMLASQFPTELVTGDG